jgi:asparagine synthase (glutamine-hydrolysing)
MCGFVGYINLGKSFDKDVLKSMALTINHRGPDNMGIWFDKKVGLGIAHNRLSIIDTSHNGNQPMKSIDGRYVIAFNGEIYNHKELRLDLIKNNKWDYGWRGSSDTETLVTCLQILGIDKTIKKLNGMFALAIFDRENNYLTLIRDRFGEKPVYYYLKDNLFIFGSELKALRKYPYLPSEIDKKSLPLFLRYGYVPSPFSIYKNIFKLEPSSQITINLENCSIVEKKCYWNFKKKP